jgi:hypothetical protein
MVREKIEKLGDYAVKKVSILIVFLCVASILLQAGCSRVQDISVQEDNVGKETSIYLEDALNLITVLEETHPAFVLGDISDNYEQEKQKLINSITKDTNKDEFRYFVQKYLTLLKDGHTNIQRDTNMQFLNLNYYAVGEELFLLNEDGNLSENRVTQIGGVPIKKIYETVQTYFVAENDAANDLNNNMWALNREVLKLAGCDIINNSVDITIDQNGLISNEKKEFIEKNIYESYNYSIEIESKMINDIFYIDMNICNVNSALENEIVKLKEAIKNGITKIIIDVRDNPGGNSLACEKLLNAMDMNVPNYGVYVRYSKLAHNKYRTVPSEGFEQSDPDKNTAKRNESIELVVLMNEKTFSSATMMATFVKDGGLGTVIGTPSSNSPSSYGDILYYRMSNSGINVSISYKRFLRPDTETNQRILLPDIVTKYNTDILAIAIDYLSTN